MGCPRKVLFFLLLLPLSNAFSIRPPSEEIFSNQLCPDPTTKSDKYVSSPLSIPEAGPFSTHVSWTSWFSSGGNSKEKPNFSPRSLMPRKVMAINLDKPKDSTHFYESCTFKEQREPAGGGVAKSKGKGEVRVRSINLNVNSWDFSSAQNCSTFIKFNNWDDHDGGRYPVLCGRENFDQYLGPYGHPMVLYYQWKNGGLSFPLFHSSYGEHNQDRKETLELHYVQIYFHVMPVGGTKEGSKKCRVQQYRVDWLRLGCSSVMNEAEPVCGEYHCQDLEALYQSKMTIFKDGEGDNDTVLVWKSKNDKYKMRTFLRQKFVPVVFLIVLVCAYRSYMKAGLRYQNSIQDDIPEYTVRPLFRARRGPARTPGRSVVAHHEAGNDPFWDFDDDENDPPPSYLARNDTTDIPETIIRVPGAGDNNIPPPTITSPNMQPKFTDEASEQPPPPYESVCPPPPYKEVIKPDSQLNS